MAWNNWNSIGTGGIFGFLKSFVTQPLQAPLQPAFTALLFIPAGPKMIIGLLTPTIFYVAIFALVYKILRATYPVFESLCLAFFISQLNFLVSYSRNYNFAIITTFFVLSAFYLIVFTKLSSWKQNMLLGVILGFILLSRTVSIIYIPFLIGLLIFIQITEKRKLLEMLRNYLFMAGTFFVVTYAWLNKNYHLVYSYLTNYGYGEQSKEYGSLNSLFSIRNFLDQITRYTINQYSILLLIVFIIIPLLIVTIKILNKNRNLSKENQNHQVPKKVIYGFLFIILGSTLVLMSSRNKGSGFDLPLIVLTNLLILISFKTNKSNFMRITMSIFVVIQLMIYADSKSFRFISNTSVSIPLTNIELQFSPENNINLGYLRGGLNGEDLNQDEINRFSWLTNGQDSELEWNKAKVKIIRFLEETNADSQFVLLTTRHRIINPNSINLIRVQERKSMIPFRFLPAQEISQSTESDTRRIISSEFEINPCTVILSSGSINEILPLVSQNFVKEELIRNQYRMQVEIKFPDDRSVEIYQNKNKCPN